MPDRVIEVRNLSVAYHDQIVLEQISFVVNSHTLVGIIGPNGAGKSTLIKAIMGLVPTLSGEVRVFNQPVSKMRKQIAYVPQRNVLDQDFPVLVEDVVLMGRYPHLRWWQRPTAKDREIAKQCLEQVGMLDFSKRQIGELSGGQQQRVFLARALAQEADLFFLDEPFAGIDMTSEQIIINLLRKLRDQGKTLFVVHHDLSKVEEYFDQIALLNRQLVGYGNKEDVFQVDLISKAYNGKIAFVGDRGGTLVVSG
ncbi:ABC transporter related protein [Caldalkalibacillus thermarum TA2.A1]|uniref:ABC transporter related protein n=1 Tax=Caldalkalibacillus thermarum (strain TA2.A1) TaxID=986075 RepID=F5L7K1_CALTT|nr:metal ABC transporter ATP-binding protein [Caldalkalibacillus thermarum]EGL82715.1 ABC transporter related protein [Caldalkalibacillus thermarum TA2.A1]QZT33744.1 metal ABC transporter ATP-binding protein [Caldalkalibacillus thermarum TA2.A1]